MATLRFNRAARSNSVSSARDANNSAATTSGASSSSSSSSKTGGMKFVQKYLDECRSFYSCIYCRTHLANHDELISRSFQGNRSRAYLFNTVINVSCGPSVQRELNTGAHSVADIFCANCGTTIGWKYERAFVESQKYKEGKFIIELAHVVRENRHLELDKRDTFLGLAPPAVEQQRQRHGSQPATIGTEHQGSLSPASSSGQWSPGTSSSSSSSSASPSSSLSPPSTSRKHHRGASPRPNCRYSSPTQASSSEHNNPLRRNPVADRYNENHHLHHDDQFQTDDIDDDEVLMFPFYDDLYGNRASYSNLSASRSYQRKMQHRSLYLEASPSNWRRDASLSDSDRRGPPTSGSSTSIVSPSAAGRMPSEQTQPNLFPCSSRSIEIPFNQISRAQIDNSSNSSCRQQQLAANKRFFAAGSSSGSPPAHRQSVPPQPTPQASTSSLATVAAAAAPPAVTRNNSEHVPDSGTSAGRNEQAHSSDCHVDEEDTQFQFEHDNKQQQQQLAAGNGGDEQLLPSISNSEIVHRNSQNQIRSEPVKASGSGSDSASPAPSGLADGDEKIGAGQLLDNCDDEAPTACQSIAGSNSLSFDDEEFYDCNTDHDVSNSSFKAK